MADKSVADVYTLGNNYPVVHVHCKKDAFPWQYVHTIVSGQLGKSHLGEFLVEFAAPCPWTLFESVQRPFYERTFAIVDVQFYTAKDG